MVCFQKKSWKSVERYTEKTNVYHWYEKNQRWKPIFKRKLKEVRMYTSLVWKEIENEQLFEKNLEKIPEK